jgi:uncharacterized protein YjbI with pentapeptide repeats
MHLFDKNIRDDSQAPTSAKKRHLLQKMRSLKLSADELQQNYTQGRRDFRGVNLSDQILSRVDLGGADLSEAKLHKTVLERANLTRVNLSGADLSEANLRRADLIWANLRKANLRGANLRGADLSGANLSGADLKGADLGGAILPDGSVLLTSQPSSLLSFSNKQSNT